MKLVLEDVISFLVVYSVRVLVTSTPVSREERVLYPLGVSVAAAAGRALVCAIKCPHARTGYSDLPIVDAAALAFTLTVREGIDELNREARGYDTAVVWMVALFFALFSDWWDYMGLKTPAYAPINENGTRNVTLLDVLGRMKSRLASYMSFLAVYTTIQLSAEDPSEHQTRVITGLSIAAGCKLLSCLIS
jgi:hypothetical protein